MSKFSNALSKAGKSLQGMPKGKKIYASLWALTGTLLAILIGLFVGLSTSSTVKDESKAEWKVEEKQVAAKELKFDDKNNNNVIDLGELKVGKDTVYSLVLNGVKTDLAGLTKVKIDDLNLANVTNLQPNLKFNASGVTTRYVKRDNADIGVYKTNGNELDKDTHVVIPLNKDASTWDKQFNVKTSQDDFQFVNPNSILPTLSWDEKDANGKLIATHTVDNTNYDKDLTGIYFIAESKQKDLDSKQAEIDKITDATEKNKAQAEQDKAVADAQKFTIQNAFYSYDYARTDSGAATWGNKDDNWSLSVTAHAASQQNAIASVGALFAVSIAGSIFTTAGVEYATRRKAKLGGNK